MGENTPEPWVADGFEVYGGASGLPIADCHLSGEQVERDNARLVAAAPELRTVARKALQLASVASDWNLSEVEIDGQMVPIYALMAEFSAAIAKAGGGS